LIGNKLIDEQRRPLLAQQNHQRNNNIQTSENIYESSDSETGNNHIFENNESNAEHVQIQQLQRLLRGALCLSSNNNKDTNIPTTTNITTTTTTNIDNAPIIMSTSQNNTDILHKSNSSDSEHSFADLTTYDIDCVLNNNYEAMTSDYTNFAKELHQRAEKKCDVIQQTQAAGASAVYQVCVRVCQ
jgi:hypothetical protein